MAAPEAQDVATIIEQRRAAEKRRESQQGLGKPIISAEFQGYRVTAVGNRVHFSKTHKTFIDFLGDYIRATLGADWGNAELAKPLGERHQILQWYDSICVLQKRNMRFGAGELQSMPMIGLTCSYYNLAYNLYLLQHNAELQQYLVSRLKRSDGFYAAYYETYVAAWFILAGFDLHLEDEQDSSRNHPEFIATRDGESFSVEAKARQPLKSNFDIGNQLYKALRVQAACRRVIFIDMNVGANVDYDDFKEKALSAIRGRENSLTIDGNPAPPAHIFVTNHPYHLALEETEIPRVCLTAGFKIDDFGHDSQFPSYTEAHKARRKYSALHDVQKAIASYSIPMTFDGEVPEFAFGNAERRFVIGEKFEFRDREPVTLESGIVMEADQKACLVVVNQTGQRFIIWAALTDDELAAYRSHPETFFGRLIEVARNTENPIDLYEFFLDGYKDTPKEKLLEFMKDAPDFEALRAMTVTNLRYEYAERVTHSVLRERSNA